LTVEAGVGLPGLIHPPGRVPGTQVYLLDVQRPRRLSPPLHQRHLPRRGFEGDLNDVLPEVVDGRGLVVELDGESDVAGVQASDHEQEAR
jgi:hypothetical protein